MHLGSASVSKSASTGSVVSVALWIWLAISDELRMLSLIS